MDHPVAPPTRPTPAPLPGFDGLILGLHEDLLWQDDGPGAALGQLAASVDHASAWLGHAGHIAGAPPQLYSEYRRNLPDDFACEWHRIRQHDVLAAGLLRAGDHGLLVRRPGLSRPLSAMMERYDIGQALCVTAPGLLSQGFLFLTLYRPLDAAPFDTGDIDRARLFIRHLSVALRNRVRSDALATDPLAATLTLQGRLDRAPSGLLQRLERIGLPLPDRRLPPALLRRLLRQASVELAQGRLELRELFGLRFVVWHEPEASPGPLTGRETEVAQLYAGGAGFRAVAQGLGISPHTARNHLRTIYRKLDIGSKLELARYLSGPGGPTRQ